MFTWLKRILTSGMQPPFSSRVLNKGLSAALVWGPELAKPWRKRMALRCPLLAKEHLAELESICKRAMDFGHRSTFDLASKFGDQTKYEDFEPLMKAKYPWVDSRNLSRLFSQGMYYA